MKKIIKNTSPYRVGVGGWGREIRGGVIIKKPTLYAQITFGKEKCMKEVPKSYQALSPQRGIRIEGVKGYCD